MEKIPQKLEQKMSEKYAGTPVAGYGERKLDFSGLGVKKKPVRACARSSWSRPAGLPTAVSTGH